MSIKVGVGMQQIAADLRLIWPPPLFVDTTKFEVHVATLTCWGHYHILDIGLYVNSYYKTSLFTDMVKKILGQ